MYQRFASKLTCVVQLALALDLNNVSEYDVCDKKKSELLKLWQPEKGKKDADKTNTEAQKKVDQDAGNNLRGEAVDQHPVDVGACTNTNRNTSNMSPAGNEEEGAKPSAMSQGAGLCSSPDAEASGNEGVDAAERRRRLRAELELGHQKFKNVLCHIVSLLHAVALSTLRDDHNLSNLVVRCFCSTHCGAFPLCTRASTSLMPHVKMHVKGDICSQVKK
jgi:hypothetical protein